MLIKGRKVDNNWAGKYIKEYNQMISYYEKQLSQKDSYIQELEKEIENLKDKKHLNLNQKQIKDEDINKIKKLREEGLSYSKISEKTGWSKTTISRVMNNKVV